jgi:hypothetical protein
MMVSGVLSADVRGGVAVAGYSQCIPKLHFGLRAVFFGPPRTVRFKQSGLPLLGPP